MEVNKMINIAMTEEELKEAILMWLECHVPKGYTEHMKENNWIVEMGDDDGCIISVDGTLPDVTLR